MAATYWLLIAIGLLIILLAMAAKMALAGKKKPTDYYSLFVGGVVWLIFGIAMQSTIFLAGGVILLSIGFAHKKEWEKNCAKEGKYAKYAIAAGFIVAFILAASFLYMGDSKSRESKIIDFESCAAAGNPVMESYPRQCSANGVTYVEKIYDVIECKPEQRNADVCAEIYKPVCAKVNIQCITTPCNPIDETFSNSCEACKNTMVESYRVGEC